MRGGSTLRSGTSSIYSRSSRPWSPPNPDLYSPISSPTTSHHPLSDTASSRTPSQSKSYTLASQRSSQRLPGSFRSDKLSFPDSDFKPERENVLSPTISISGPSQETRESDGPFELDATTTHELMGDLAPAVPDKNERRKSLVRKSVPSRNEADGIQERLAKLEEMVLRLQAEKAELQNSERH
jgi:hypothetical protein